MYYLHHSGFTLTFWDFDSWNAYAGTQWHLIQKQNQKGGLDCKFQAWEVISRLMVKSYVPILAH